MAGHLHDVLLAAVGQGADQSQQQYAQNVLLQMEGSPGFVPELVGAITTTELHSDARLMAVMCLKTTVARCWKARGSNTVVADGEKEQLRKFLASYFSEQNRQVSTHLAMLAAKLARADWHDDWPEAFECLYPPLMSNDHTQRVNALYRLHRTLKELGLRSRSIGRQQYAQTCAALFPTMHALFTGAMEQTLGALKSGDLSQLSDDPVGFIDLLMTMLKIVNRLLVFGLAELLSNSSTDIGEFMSNFVGCMQQLLQYLRENITPDNDKDDSDADTQADLPSLLKKLVKRMSAVLLQVQAAQPLLCRQWLPSLLQFFYSELLAECAKQTKPFTGFAINAILFMSKSISCSVYNPDSAESRAGRTRTTAGDVKFTIDEVHEARAILSRVLTDQVVEQLMHLLLHHFLHLTARDLELWASAPEDFMMAEETSNEQDSIQTSSESLFLALVEVTPDLVLQRIVQLLSDAQSQLNICEQRSITADTLTLDATYLCAGLASFALMQTISGDQLVSMCLGSVIQKLLQVEDAQPPAILRRRILWLMRCWAHAFEDSLPNVVALAVQLLQSTGALCDTVVKLSCVKLLAAVLQRVDVPALRQAIAPHLHGLLHGIYNLIGELEELESKSQAVELLTETVTVAGDSIGPFVQALVEPLPSLWVASNTENPLHPALLAAVTAMVRTCGKHSNQLYPVALQMIQFACNGEETNSYLVAEGLQLWLAVMRNAPVYVAELHALFPRVTALQVETLMGSEQNLLQTALLVIEAYAYLGGEHVLQSYAAEIVKLEEELLHGVVLGVAQYLVRILEAFLLVCPEAATNFLVQSGLLHTLLGHCLDFAAGGQDDPPVQVAMYMSVFAKVILVDPAQLNHVCEAMVSNGRSRSVDEALDVLFTVFFDLFDSLGYASSGSYRRRLWAVSWLSLYPSNNLQLISQLHQVLTATEQVYAEEISESGQERLQSLNKLLVAQSDEMMFFEDPHGFAPEVETPVEALTEIVSGLLASDPVMTTNLQQEAIAKMTQYQQLLPERDFQDLLSRIDDHVRSTLLSLS